MKQKSLLGLMLLFSGLAPIAVGQPSQIWENWGIVQMPPPIESIDALTFVNHSGASFTFSGTALFNTFDTVNYTNQGSMVGNPGFDFETVSPNTGFARRAANFVNLASGLGPNDGLIDCSGAFAFIIAPNLIFGNLTGSSKCLIDADNIINSGTINMTASSLIKMTGKTIDLSHGAITMANPSSTFGLFFAGQLDGYWGVGTAANPFRPFFPFFDPAPVLFPQNLLAGITPIHFVTPRNYIQFYQQIVLNNPTTYVNDTGIVGSNRMVQAVFLVNTNASFVNSVYFTPFEIAVQWQWSTTNYPTGTVNTNNYMYVLDDFGEVTNLQVALDGFAGVRPTFMPVTYAWFFGAAFSPRPGASPTTPPGGIFGFRSVTNQYAAYEAIFTSATQLPTDLAGGNVTNMGGRIELNAESTLNLNQARLDSLNYLRLNCTNHFLGSDHAFISAPNQDIYLRTTNGVLAITNLVAPYLNHIEGFCDLYSTRWTNVVGSITNSFHVLFVDSQIAPYTIPRIQTLRLTVTNASGAPNNLFISDILNVTSNLTLNAERITITTNILDPFTPFGRINILNPDIVWSTATPGLQYLTNWGAINMQNAVYFGGSRTQPPYNTNLVDIPYQAFVNHGGVTNQASLVWSDYFENTGTFDCGQGSFNLQKASNTFMTNGAIYAGGEIALASGSLQISNTILRAGAALTLSVANLLDDATFAAGGADYVTNKNGWFVGNGINLPVLPARSSLLSTMITNRAPDFQLTVNHWAGADRGRIPRGFDNNAAIGLLILDGLTNCTFEFRGTGAANAMYVDFLDLRDFVAANVDRAGNFLSITCAPNMKVYFGQAMANGQSIAEKLPLVNGGRFQWVSNYNTGFFSSTNIVYPDGTTNRLNTALVTSCDIDSNGNGIPNCRDPAPIPVLLAEYVGLTADYVEKPTPGARVSWMAFPMTSSSLLAAPSAGSTNWEVVTNFLYTGPYPGRVTVTDPIKTNAPRFYRVRISSP